VLLSAVARRAASRILDVEDFVIVTTEATIGEVHEHAAKFAVRYTLDLDLLHEAIELLPIERYSERQYRSHLAEARKYLGARDADDIHLGALALKLAIPVWSNDDDLRELPLRVYTTAELLKILGA
jgi:predicted nucleic acid-binding protein